SCYLSLSTPRKRKAWAWACRSAVPSSPSMAGSCPSATTPTAARRSTSPCPCRGSKMSDLRPTVFVVDDDEPVRDSIGMLLETVDLPYESFPDAQTFLDAYHPSRN